MQRQDIRPGEKYIAAYKGRTVTVTVRQHLGAGKWKCLLRGRIVHIYSKQIEELAADRLTRDALSVACRNAAKRLQRKSSGVIGAQVYGRWSKEHGHAVAVVLTDTGIRAIATATGMPVSGDLHADALSVVARYSAYVDAESVIKENWRSVRAYITPDGFLEMCDQVAPATVRPTQIDLLTD